MIIVLLLNLLVMIIGVIFSWLPVVETLPTILGINIDEQMVLGVGYMQRFAETFWPLQILFQGFLLLMIYYILKMTLKFFFGHRAP